MCQCIFNSQAKFIEQKLIIVENHEIKAGNGHIIYVVFHEKRLFVCYLMKQLKNE